MDDSDWEYEYDPNETEDFYFTLDITTNDPTTTKGSARLAAAKPTLPATSLRSQDSLGERPSTADPTLIQDPPAPAGRLQILDLHTPQPFVKLDNDLYACEWIDDLGTQLFVVEPGAVSEPVRSGSTVDVVGFSQIRLLAKPIQVRRHPVNKRFGDSASNEPIVIDDNVPTPRPGILHIPPGMVSNERTKKQASFLQRLSRIKADKQQSPIVFASEVRNYKPPADRNEIRQRALNAIAFERSTEDARKTDEQKGKARKRKRYPGGEEEEDSPRATPSGPSQNG